MKYLIAVFFLTPLFFSVQDAKAIVKIDSVYADSCYQDGVYSMMPRDSAAMFKKPDSAYGQLSGNGPLIDLAFKKYKKDEIQPIKPNSQILVWGKKDKTADSSAGQLTFNRYDESQGMLISSNPVILEDGLQTITVPLASADINVTWDYVELSLAGDFVKHATSYFIDAVALLQDTTPPMKNVIDREMPINQITSYPNPFNSNTTIRLSLPTEGDVQLSVIDALGREIDHLNAGYFESGDHEIPLAIRTPGFYFVRLLVNGIVIGNPLKITSR